MTPPLREGAADLSETIGQPGAAALPRPTGIGEILSTALQLYRRHWRTLLTIAAVVVVPLTLLQYLLGDLVRTQGESTRNGVVETATWSVGIAGLLAALAVILMYLVLTGAITRAVAAEVAGEEPGVEQSYRFGFHRLGSVLLVSVLVGLATSRRGTEAMGRSWGWSVATVVTLPYGALVGVLLYVDLRARKESLTMEALRTDLQASAAGSYWSRGAPTARRPGRPAEDRVADRPGDGGR
jgi:hypothetical protein